MFKNNKTVRRTVLAFLALTLLVCMCITVVSAYTG